MNDIVEQIIEDFEPSDEVVYPENKNIFLFAHRLKGLEIFKDIEDPPLDLRDVVEKWYERWDEKMVDKFGGQLSFDDVWADFLYSWGKVKYCQNPLFLAIEKAKMSQIIIPKAKHIKDNAILFLIKVCYELQEIQNQGSPFLGNYKNSVPFYLSSYKAGDILGKSQGRAFVIMKMLVDEQILEVAKKGNAHKATRYRFKGKAWYLEIL